MVQLVPTPPANRVELAAFGLSTADQRHPIANGKHNPVNPFISRDLVVQIPNRHGTEIEIAAIDDAS